MELSLGQHIFIIKFDNHPYKFHNLVSFLLVIFYLCIFKISTKIFIVP